MIQEAVKYKRPHVLRGRTYQMPTGCGPQYLTLNETEEGQLVELFLTHGKAGGCAACQGEAIGRMVSLSLKSGVPVQGCIKQLGGISCHAAMTSGEIRTLSCADAVAQVLQFWLEDKKAEMEAEAASSEKKLAIAA